MQPNLYFTSLVFVCGEVLLSRLPKRLPRGLCLFFSFLCVQFSSLSLRYDLDTFRFWTALISASVFGTALKKPSKRPCVEPLFDLFNFCTALRTRSSLLVNRTIGTWILCLCIDTRQFLLRLLVTILTKWWAANSTSIVSGSVTSGFLKSSLASWYGQSSGTGYFFLSITWIIFSNVLCSLIKDKALWGPMPRILSK